MSETPQTPAPVDPNAASASGHHPAVQEILDHFDNSHLTGDLKALSGRFKDLAHEVAGQAQGPMLTTGLHRLWEAKNAVVAAAALAARKAKNTAEKI